VGWVVLFSTLAGLIYGAWVDGVSLWLLGMYLTTFLGALALALYFVNKRNTYKATTRVASSH
jgi:hypothetical protein